MHRCLAESVRRLANDASGAGIPLGATGWYRSYQRQVELRREHCGPTYYDIYEKPSSECNPPTARPGSSMHERGLAIDFDCFDGQGGVQQGDVCFNWLSANASRYGLYNLPSEAWHWSTNGH